MATKVNFLIKQGDVKKRIFKLFVDKGDIFVSFPYFNSTHYYCGVGCIPAGMTEYNLNPVHEGNESIIPVKLSYHCDGQVHFKPIKSSIKNLPPSFKNAELKCNSFVKLKAQHIITVEVENLSQYEDFIPTKPSELYRGFNVPLNAKRFKFVFYAGLSEDDMKGKFKHCKFIEIDRPSAPNPFIIGLYFTSFPESLDKSNPHPLLLCLAGFAEGMVSKDSDSRFLYLMAK
jgi:hypothetical protein